LVQTPEIGLALLLMLPFSLDPQVLPSHVGVQALLQALLVPERPYDRNLGNGPWRGVGYVGGKSSACVSREAERGKDRTDKRIRQATH
jgi:hypothetical protein